MLDKLLNFKDSRTLTINSLCNIFKIDKFKLLQQNKQDLKVSFYYNYYFNYLLLIFTDLIFNEFREINLIRQ